MKLSKAQAEVLETAKREIDGARRCETFDEYFVNNEARGFNSSCNTPEKYKAKYPEDWEELKKYWESKKNGIVLTHCNSKTIQKLEKLGLIEIIEDSCGQYFGIDKIKVLNY